MPSVLLLLFFLASPAYSTDSVRRFATECALPNSWNADIKRFQIPEQVELSMKRVHEVLKKSNADELEQLIHFYERQYGFRLNWKTWELTKENYPEAEEIPKHISSGDFSFAYKYLKQLKSVKEDLARVESGEIPFPEEKGIRQAALEHRINYVHNALEVLTHHFYTEKGQIRVSREGSYPTREMTTDLESIDPADVPLHFPLKEAQAFPDLIFSQITVKSAISSNELAMKFAKRNLEDLLRKEQELNHQLTIVTSEIEAVLSHYQISYDFSSGGKIVFKVITAD